MRYLITAVPLLLAAAPASAGDTLDLDDVSQWDLVSVETCLDAATDVVPGDVRKLELKIEGDDPVYEFEIERDGTKYNVECNAEEGIVGEIEREVSADDATFKELAKVSEADARKLALAIHPGKVVAMEYEIGSEGPTYEYDIQTTVGYEVKVDVSAVTGEIEESNIEIYEIGAEAE
jgi:uncharacterized membrane protein YkoI